MIRFLKNQVINCIQGHDARSKKDKELGTEKKWAIPSGHMTDTVHNNETC